MKNHLETRFFILIILLLVGLNSIAQIKSYSISSAEIDPGADGFYYGLPKHTIRVDVKVKKIEKFKGKYSDYATKLLGITDYIIKDATTFELKNFNIDIITDLDSANIYFAQLPSKFEDNKTFIVNMMDNGLISNVSVIEKEQIQNNKGNKAPFTELLKPVLIEKVDTITRKVTIDTTVIEEKVLKRNISEKTNEQQAKEIADLIYKIEESKYNLITGYQEVNYSMESIKFMLEKLSTLESDYLAFFKGAIKESESVVSFYFTPVNNDESNIVTLFRFSSSDGIIESNRVTGDPIIIYINRENFYSEALKLENKRFSVKKKEKGLYYRIPESVMIQIKSANNVLISKKAYISQMGVLSFLPSKVLSNVTFSESGFIKSIKFQE